MAGTRGSTRGATDQGNKQGRALLTAVERIVDAPEAIRAQVEQLAAEARRGLPDDATEAQVRTAVERTLVSHYSNRTALAGGAAALPGLIPGLGGLAAILGGGLLDMTLCLKFEVEMVLALACARGYDIEDPRERQLAYLLAAAHTYEASSGQNPLADVFKVEADAIWNYTPRQLGKLVAALFVKLAILHAGKGLVRALPLVGVVVSSAANKTLTGRVGKAVIKALDGRRPPAASEARAARRPAARRKAKPAAAKGSKPTAARSAGKKPKTAGRARSAGARSQR